MATTLLVLLIAWIVTVPIVLGLARVLDRMTRPKVPAREEPLDPLVEIENIVPLVPRGRNDLVVARDLRRAS